MVEEPDCDNLGYDPRYLRHGSICRPLRAGATDRGPWLPVRWRGLPGGSPVALRSRRAVASPNGLDADACRRHGDVLDAVVAAARALPSALERTSSSWARTENEAPVALLYRTRVHWVQLGEACDIALVHLNRVRKYDPIDCLTARRCRERSLVVVVRTLGRQ